MAFEILRHTYLLQKMPEKGGWTFLIVSEIPKRLQKRIAHAKLTCILDGIQFEKISLMPMKTGQLFMPVKAEIRKAINKEAGEWVELAVFSELPLEDEESIATQFALCLENEPVAQNNFNQLAEHEKQQLYKSFEEAGNDDIKVRRMAIAIDRLNR